MGLALARGMAIELGTMTTAESDAFVVLLAEAVSAALDVTDRSRREGYRMRPKVDPMIDRWSQLALGSTPAPQTRRSGVDSSVAHMFAEGSMQQRAAQMIEWSTPPVEEDELLSWLSGSPDVVPNQAGLVLECVRDYLGRGAVTGVKDIVSYTRDLYSYLDADDAFDALAQDAIDRFREGGDLAAARASMRERAGDVLRDKSP